MVDNQHSENGQGCGHGLQRVLLAKTLRIVENMIKHFCSGVC